MLFNESNMGRLRGAARLFTAWILAWLAVAAHAAPSLTEARDLAADARIMRTRQLPMLVLFSRAQCPWCERLRREYLVGINAEAKPRVLLREVRIDADTPLTDFDGRPSTHRSFATRHAAKLAPTLMVMGPQGETLADALVGYQTPDFFGALIDDAIESGRDRMRNVSP